MLDLAFTGPAPRHSMRAAVAQGRARLKAILGVTTARETGDHERRR
jgi:hypothetical protein